MRILAPFGYYGWGNIGDEATLQGFARLVSLGHIPARVTVGTCNPAHTKRVEPAFRYYSVTTRDPRRWLALLTSNAQAIVGGTPIMDIEGAWPLSELAPLVRSASRMRIPLAFIGVGTETLRLDQSRRIVAEQIAPRVRHWSVRCDRDKQRLTEYGVPLDAITVAADMAWLIESAMPDFGRSRLRRWGVQPGQPLICVNLVNENLVFDQNPRMVDALAGALDELVGTLDSRVLFLANEIRDDAKYDRAAAMQVIRRMRRSERTVLAPNEYFAPHEMMSLVGCCDLALSMRYHFCLFSALQRVPFVALLRSDKVADLCWDMNWPAAVRLPHFDPAEIIAHGIRFRHGASALADQLQEAVEKMSRRALRNTIALNQLRADRSVAVADRSPAERES